MRYLYLIHRHYSVFLIICVIVLGIFLRYKNYQSVPRLGATFDEFAWTWLGINIIQKGVPISWSSQPQYTLRTHVEYLGAKFFIVEPYLEHPPLFGILAGAFAIARGADTIFSVTLQKIRPFALVISIYTLGIFLLTTWKVLGRKNALFSTAIFATMPTTVIGSRIVQNENFLIAIWITTLLFLYQFLQTKKRLYFWITVILCGLASLAKVPWLIVAISCLLILSYRNKWKDGMILILVVFGFFSLFLFYGFWLDRQLFISLWSLQLARYDIHFHGFFSIFTHPLLVDRWYLDGWIYFGWFAFFLILRKTKKYYMFTLPCMSYVLLYIFAIPDEPLHGWYRFPFTPFLSIAISIFIEKELSKLSFQRLFIYLFVGLSLLGLTWESKYGFSFPLYRFYIIFCCIITFFPLWFRRVAFIAKPTFYLWFISMIFLNVWAVLSYSDI